MRPRDPPRRAHHRRPLPARLLTPRARPRVQLRSLPDKRVCLDNFDTLLLTIDEMVRSRRREDPTHPRDACLAPRALESGCTPNGVPTAC